MTTLDRVSNVDTDERPAGRKPLTRDDVAEMGLPALAAVAAVWVPFHLAGINGPFGFLVCWFFVFLLIFGVLSYRSHGLLQTKDRLATVVVTTGALVALLPVFLICYYVLAKGAGPLFTHFPHFLTTDLRHFGPHDPVTRAGVKHAIIGTVEQVTIATLLTVPIGVLTAAYLNEVGGRFASAVRTIADAMTGLPSIIAGLFVYGSWVLGGHNYSGFAGSLALSVVMLPTVVRTAEEVLRIVSNSLREAALALGASEWRVVLMVVLPTARAGLVTASILGVARAVGETAPILLTTFGSHATNWNPLHGAQSSLTSQVYELIRSPTTQNQQVAWGAALVLVTIVLTLFALARILGSGGSRGKKRRIRFRTTHLGPSA